MNQLKKIVLLLVVILLAVATYTWFFVWNKPQTNVAKADALKIEASALLNEYTTNEQTANQKYLEKILEVTGVVMSITKNAEGQTVVLLKTNDPVFGINCTMEEKEVVLKEGDTVTLKGICTGYLTDVVLIRCYKVNG
jgi:DNA/RNA endonuclease YhcR with UshA esterase domain